MISFSNYNAHSIDIFKQLNILHLNKFVINRIGIMMYKYANNLLPPVINDIGCPTITGGSPGLLGAKCARRARLCVWIGLTNILFIDESMAVHWSWNVLFRFSLS